MLTKLIRAAADLFPKGAREFLKRNIGRNSCTPPPGAVCLGDLRRLTPFSNQWGYDRGMPVDRYYIEKFVANHSADIKGHVLEIAENDYTLKFGGGSVVKSDVLHVEKGYPGATICADLSEGNSIPSNQFDCVICTQTLQVILDADRALRTLLRILKPGGVLLITGSGICKVFLEENGLYHCCWRITRPALARYIKRIDMIEEAQTYSYGNLLSATAFLYGMAAEELKPDELDYHDAQFEVTVAARLVKAVEKPGSMHGTL